MKIEEIKYFRPDGKDRRPSGVCYYNAGMLKAIEDNEKSFIRQPLTESFLTEKIMDADNQYGFAKYRGGMIVFALTVNATVDAVEPNKLKGALKKTYYSVMNHVFKDRKLNNLVKTWNKEFGDIDDMYLGAMTVGKNFKGKYQSGNQIYNDKSTSLELGGVPSELLLLFAIELCKEFKQESVLVKDFNTNKIFLVDSEGIEGNNAQEKLVNASKELDKTKELNTQAESIESLNEMARLSRIKQHLDSGEEVCLISACRSERSHNENNRQTKSLANSLKALGYSFIQVNGGYTENKGLPNEQDVLESSFFVINNANKDTFDKDMFWLCKKYDQEVILLRSNKYVAAWYDFAGNRASKPLTKFSIHDIEDGFTKIHGSKFALVPEDNTFEESALLKPNVARFVAGKWLRKLIDSNHYNWDNN